MSQQFDRFDPEREGWSSYLMRAEFYFESMAVMTDLRKKALLCSSMSPEIFALLKNLLTEEVTEVSYAEITTALHLHFEESQNFLAAHLDFYWMVQQEGQSITEFLVELRTKAKACDFKAQCCEKCQDNALRNRLVMGCKRFSRNQTPH